MPVSITKTGLGVMLEQELADSLLPRSLDKSPAEMKKPLSRLFRPPVEIGEEKNDFTRWIFHKKRINDEDVHVSGQFRLMAKSSSKKTFATDNQQEQEAYEVSDQYVETLPRHLQKLVDQFCRQNSLSVRNRPCAQGLKSSGVEENGLGKLISLVHGRTGEPLEAKKCLVRNKNPALIVDGPGLSQASIIRFYPRATGIGGISAWMVWKGLEGVESGFLIFKLVGTSFPNVDGQRRKELLVLQSSCKRTKMDAFIPIKAKPATRSTKLTVGITTSGEPKDTGNIRALQQAAAWDPPSLQTGELRRSSKKYKTSIASSGEMIDLTEEAHASTSVKGSAKKEEVASADVLQPKPHQASNSVTLKDSTVSYSRREISTKRSADPSFFPSELISYIRENTLFSFINSSHEVSRTRRSDICDTAGRLFLQADVGGV